MKRIILFMIPLIAVIISFSPSDKHIISGIITDENKNPLPGASVTIKGTGITTSSDQKGFYSIEVNSKNAKLGSGHTVTALYEIIPAGVESEFLIDVDPLKYQPNKKPATANSGDELLTVKFRYKEPSKDNSELIVHPVSNKEIAFNKTSPDFRFAAAVAGFGMVLRESEFKGSSNYNQILHIANNAVGNDKEGYRKEFITLVKKAANLSNNPEDVGIAEDGDD